MNSRLLGCLVLAVLIVGTVADGADTEVSNDAEKPADKKKDVKPSKTFKPVMISRETRHAVYPHRHDIQYTDGGMSHVIHFPAPRDNRVKALVGRRRVFRWLPRPKQFIEPLYNDEYDFLTRRPRMYLPRSLFRRSRRAASRPSAYDAFGLPQFPPLPRSARRHLARTPSYPSATFTSNVISHGQGRRNSYGVVEYPKYGVGARANLQKLDFALDRLSSLNTRLREAEARVATARAASKRVDRQIAALTRIRGNIRKMATQIAELEQKLGRDQSMQREVASVAQFGPAGIPSLGSDTLGQWLGDYISV
jgi:hypothetical protein